MSWLLLAMRGHMIALLYQPFNTSQSKSFLREVAVQESGPTVRLPCSFHYDTLIALLHVSILHRDRNSFLHGRNHYIFVLTLQTRKLFH